MDSNQGSTTTTTTVKRTTRVTESAEIEQVRQNLRQVAEGLDEVRAKAREEVEALDNLMRLLSADSVSGLIGIVEELEERITTMENANEDASAARDEALAELEAEKARLTKLWDAYKAQEDELRRAKRDEPILREQLADRDRTIAELEDEVAHARAAESYKERYHGLSRDHERLQASYKELEADLRQRTATIAELEAKAEQLKSFEDDSRRVKELERQLNEEKERLAKLYKVYEDTEDKLRDAEDEAARWREWYDRHRQAFEMVGDAATYPVRTAEE